MMHTIKIGTLGALAAIGFAAQVCAQPAPSTEGGRFSFTPVRDGLMRLDVKTGQVSMCKADNNGWACDITPDERTAFDTEIGRLSAENARLRKELSSRTAQSDADAAVKSDAAKADAAKAESAKAESAKAEAVARAETARAEAAKAEANAKAEASRAETAKAEAAAKADAARIETAKAETAKAEVVKAEAVKADAAKAEAAKTESAKTETKAAAPVTAEKTGPSTGTKAVITLDKDGKADTTIVVPLPSDQQVAEAKSFLTRAWQQFVETVNRWRQETFNRS